VSLRVIVCGSRHAADYAMVARVLNLVLGARALREVTIVHGDQRGVDAFAKQWAKSKGIAQEPHPYKGELGKAGGPVRNREMLDAGADFVLAFPGGSGTADIVRQARVRQMLVLQVLR
jgi:hypothetical protein